MENNQFLLNESKFDFSATIEKLSEQILSEGWKISVTHDLQETLKKSGQEVLPIKILEICKPEYSGKLLSVDSLRLYSPLMPCRISIYETGDGKIYISRMNSEAMANQIGGVVAEVMGKAFGEIENILAMVLK